MSLLRLLAVRAAENHRSSVRLVGTNTIGFSGTGTGSAPVPFPAAAAAGNYCVVAVSNDYSGYPTVPSGWTLLAEGSTTISGQDVMMVGKLLTSSDITAGSVSFVYGGTHGGEYSGLSAAWSGISVAFPIDVASSASNNTNNAAPVTVTASGVTTTVTNDLLLALFGKDNTTNTSPTIFSVPSGWAEVAASNEPNNWSPLLMASKMQSAAGASGSASSVDSVLPGGWIGLMVALKPYPQPMTLTGTLPAGTVGVAYSASLTLSGDYVGPVTLSVSSGTLPAWMTVTVSGSTVTYAGTPTTAETETFTPKATDSSVTPQIATDAQSIVISAASSGASIGAMASVNGTTTTGVTTAASGSSFAIVTGEYNPGTSIAAPTDNKGNTYIAVFHVDSGTSYRATLWLCTNGVGGTGHTWTDHDTKPYGTLTAVEIKGGALSALLDGYVGAATTGAGPWASGSLTTTAANDLMVGFAVYDWPSTNSGITAVAAGYTLNHDCLLSDDINSAICSKASVAAGAQSTSFSSSSASVGITLLAAFKHA